MESIVFDTRPNIGSLIVIFLLTTSQEMILSNCGKTCLLASLVPFVMPDDALAEVCEPDNSLWNMPLLFAIAMVGATVGGMVHLAPLFNLIRC
jgi:hypothetical protein